MPFSFRCCPTGTGPDFTTKTVSWRTRTTKGMNSSTRTVRYVVLSNTSFSYPKLQNNFLVLKFGEHSEMTSYIKNTVARDLSLTSQY